MKINSIPIKYQRYCASLFPTIKHLNIRLDYARKLKAQAFLQKRSSNPFSSFHHLLRKQKLLSKLSLVLDWKRNYITSRDISLFASLPKSIANLKCLSLTFSAYGSGCLSTKLLSLYKSFFKHCKFLQKLELDFSTTEIYQDDIFYICQGIKSLKSLKILKINMSSCLGVTDKGIKFFKSLLNRSKGLTHLKLDLEASPSFSKRSFHSLSKARLPNLEVFDLNIIRNSDPYSLSASSHLIATTSSLRKLSIGISKARLNYIAKLVSNHVNTLETVRLKASHLEHKREDDQINKENAFSFLLTLKKLKTLELDFSHAKMHQTFTISLWQTLELLKDLESLNLNLLFCEGVEEKNIKQINKALESFAKLKEFTLIIGANSSEEKLKLNDKLFLSLHEGLGKLQDLRKFTFECWGSDNITDNTISLFDRTLSKHENLVELYIGFPNCRKITDKGLKPLCEILKLKKVLKRLSLNFADCPKLTCSSFSSICEIIKARHTLQCLNANFSKTQIEDDGVQSLLDSIKNLSEIVLNVERCPNIKKVVLSKQILKLPRLFKADFNFSFCPDCPAKDLKDLAKDIEMKAPNLAEFNISR